jgi:two-component system nitrogen regulation response regulator GlnG
VPTLLVVDDEPSILHFFRRAFCARGIHIETAISAQEGIDKVRALSPDVVVLDVNLCEQSGLDLFRKIQQVDARIPVIFITGRGTTATAIEAMQLGAYEYLLKPLELAELSNLVYRAFEIGRLMRVAPAIDQEPDVSSEQDAMLGRSPLMQTVYKSIGRVAARDVAVLVLGESGTGKELVARAIYHYSSRAKGPFAPPSQNRCSRVNCSDMKKGHSPVPTVCASGSSNNATAGLCSWMRSATCRL